MFGQADAGEALPPDVLDDVGEGDDAGDALGEVHPVRGPGIDVDVGAAAEGDEDAIAGMEGKGQEDEGPLEHADEREGVEELDLLGVGERAVEGFEVGEDVLDEEGADGDDAGEGVQATPGGRSGLPRRVEAGRLCVRCRGLAELRGRLRPWLLLVTTIGVPNNSTFDYSSVRTAASRELCAYRSGCAISP